MPINYKASTCCYALLTFPSDQALVLLFFQRKQQRKPPEKHLIQYQTNNPNTESPNSN